MVNERLQLLRPHGRLHGRLVFLVLVVAFAVMAVMVVVAGRRNSLGKLRYPRVHVITTHPVTDANGNANHRQTPEESRAEKAAYCHFQVPPQHHWFDSSAVTQKIAGRRTTTCENRPPHELGFCLRDTSDPTSLASPRSADQRSYAAAGFRYPVAEVVRLQAPNSHEFGYGHF
jgi:hypothetical protein